MIFLDQVPHQPILALSLPVELVSHIVLFGVVA
jgi:hypothetical protein